MKPNLIHYKKTWLNTINVNNFSSLPSAVFKKDTITKIIPNNVIQKNTKYKWRNTIVSLRAPKHFKVGRQHYSLGKRLSKTKIKNLNIQKIKIKKNIKIKDLIINIKQISTSIKIHTPLTLSKSKKISVGIIFNFLI